jgi:hypothetical protein
MSQEEKRIIILEAQIASGSSTTFESARIDTLASGQYVLSTDKGVIYREAPDGTREAVKKIDPPISVQMGSVVQLK